MQTQKWKTSNAETHNDIYQVLNKKFRQKSLKLTRKKHKQRHTNELRHKHAYKLKQSDTQTCKFGHKITYKLSQIYKLNMNKLENIDTSPVIFIYKCNSDIKGRTHTSQTLRY